MRKDACWAASYLFVFTTALFASSCSGDPSSWYPSGAASIASFLEIPETGACELTLKIVNIGRSTINSYSVSIAATTDKRTYYRTISGDLVIPPGKSVYTDAEIVYVSPSEVLASGGLSIVDMYYQ
ncbi:MAG: hypothetical protein NT061_11555 [Spirochaetes bacterium]|nr:hypothetical protein [Spirochaetota bacterium]